MGLGSFVNISIFVMKHYFIQFAYILHFFKSFKSKSTQMLRPQKGNSGVLPNDTLLNFGLRIPKGWALRPRFVTKTMQFKQ